MAAAGSYSKGSVAMDDFTCMGGRMANLKSYGVAGMSDLSTGRPTAHTGALSGFTSGIGSIRNQPQLQANATPKTEDISALWRKAILPKHTTVESGIEKCGIVLKIEPNTRQRMDPEQLFAEVAGIYYCLIRIQSNCIGLRNSQSAVNQDYNLKNEQWQHLASHFRTHFSVSQHSSTSPAIKRLAAKYAKFGSKEILDGLERIRNSNALSTSLLQTLVLQQYLWRLLEQNVCLSKEMDEELEYLLAHINEVLTRIWDGAERWVRGSSLFERLLDLSLEFAGRMRHWCTKMPWTLCTALVVLWGVCWMFHPSQSPGTIDTLFDFLDSQNLLPEASPVADSFFEDKTQYGNTQLPSLGTFIAEAPIAESPIAESPIAESMPLESPPFLASIWSPLPTGFSYVDREPLNSTVQFFQHIDLGGPSTMPHHDSSIIGQAKDLLLGFPGEREIENFAPNSWEDTITHSQVSELQVSMAMLTDSNVQTHHRDSSAIELTSFQCTDCTKIFARQWTLDRHRREKHSHKQNLFPCPAPNCKKSMPQQAFKREEKLREHLRRCKKIRLRRGTQNSNSGSQDIGTTSLSLDEENRSPSVIEGNVLSDDQLIQEMKNKYQARLAALLTKEAECQRERDYLTRLKESISNLDSKR